MIRFDGVSVTYPNTSTATLVDVNLDLPEGELVLVVGETGSGKSTLLKAVNGLVPHFTGGVLSGQVTVAGRSTRTHKPRDLADVVGAVLQDPRDGFVTDLVEDEIAYGMESLGVPPAVMRRRVEESLDLMGLADVRHRALRTLSGGQQQRTAIAGVLAQHPQVLVLDEPTSALDPNAAEEVLAALQRVVHDLGVTVLLAEHRLERVIQFADRAVHVARSGTVISGPPREVLAAASVAPPVVELGRMQSWTPAPLSVREARRLAAPLRDQLGLLPAPVRSAPPNRSEPLSISLQSATAAYGDRVALREVDLTVRPGEVVAVMGRNGAGKTTLLRAVVGLTKLSSGRIRVDQRDPQQLTPKQLQPLVGMVPQEPADLMWADSVLAECRSADVDTGAPPGTAAATFERLTPGVSPETHPRDLSEGQRLALALSIILTADSRILLLDEPTRGLDYPTKARLTSLLRERAATGHAVLVATHDVELVAEVASRAVVLADGEVVADGPTDEVVLGSPQLAPQIAKILAPLPWLTVDEITASLPAVG